MANMGTVVRGVEESIQDALRAFVSNHKNTPAYFREIARERHAEQLIEFLARTANGEMLFTETVVTNVRGGGQQYHIVPMQAPAAVRVMAAAKVLDLAIPRQVGIVDGSDRQKTGIIGLPRPALLYAQQQSEHYVENLPPHPDGLEYVIVEEDLSKVQEGIDAEADVGPDAAPPVPAPGLNPERVRAVRERARRAVEGDE